MALTSIQKRSAIAAIIAASIGGAVMLLPSGVQICDDKGVCQTFNADQYKAVKDDLRSKYMSGSTVSWQEHELFVQVLDREIKKGGKLQMQNVRSEADIKAKINELLSQ